MNEATTRNQDAPPAADTSHPQGVFDYGVIGVSSMIVIISLYLAVRYLGWPGEGGDSHIKRRILEEESS